MPKIIEIREQTVSIKSPIRNAVIDFSEMTVSAAAIITDIQVNGRPVVGFGFNSNGRYAQGGILRERLIPRLMAASPSELETDDGRNLDPFKAWNVMMRNEKPGGHGDRGVAVGVLDMAFWDLAAKIEGKPLFRLLAERYGNGKPDPQVFVYAAGGYYYPGKDLKALQNEMQGYLDLGYDTVKMKIGGADLEEDQSRIEAVLKLVSDGSKLCVDANARLDLETACRYAEGLAPYELKWYEEPVDPGDFQGLATVSEITRTPLATGENLFSFQESRNLIRHGGLHSQRDYLQMDPALSYGLVEYLKTLEMLRESGWSWRRCIPHGGHQMALSIAAGLGLGGNESYPGIFQPFGGFADGIPVIDGKVSLPEVPGIGIEQKSELNQLYQAML